MVIFHVGFYIAAERLSLMCKCVLVKVGTEF